MASTEPPETRHRIQVRVLVILASILAFLAIFTSWVDRQALDTNQWVDTSGKLIQNEKVRSALSRERSVRMPSIGRFGERRRSADPEETATA